MSLKTNLIILIRSFWQDGWRDNAVHCVKHALWISYTWIHNISVLQYYLDLWFLDDEKFWRPPGKGHRKTVRNIKIWDIQFQNITIRHKFTWFKKAWKSPTKRIIKSNMSIEYTIRTYLYLVIIIFQIEKKPKKTSFTCFVI